MKTDVRLLTRLLRRLADLVSVRLLDFKPHTQHKGSPLTFSYSGRSSCETVMVFFDKSDELLQLSDLAVLAEKSLPGDRVL